MKMFEEESLKNVSKKGITENNAQEKKQSKDQFKKLKFQNFDFDEEFETRPEAKKEQKKNPTRDENYEEIPDKHAKNKKEKENHHI